nr:hypothetical protein [Candidatus Sigynarchaeota archaeon]
MAKKEGGMMPPITRPLDQLANDLPRAIQQAAALFAAIQAGKAPPARDDTWLASVFSDYCGHLRLRKAELLKSRWPPSEDFDVYDELLGSLIDALATAAAGPPIKKNIVAKLVVFLRDLPSCTLLFN